MKNKTLSVWLTLLLGPLGLHRLYVAKRFDAWSWLLLLPTLFGGYGVLRARSLGLDDQWSWALIPWLGLSVSVSCLLAICYGLMDAEQWNRRFNANPPTHLPTRLPEDHPAGQSNWLTVIGLIAALMLGATVLLASIAFAFERYFEYQTQAPQLAASASANLKKSAS
ncbi:MAG: hypothetical protein ORN29_05370 [Rhodoferax sp.]|nr:hypothetical protein [Rhodoferax sp.]